MTTSIFMEKNKQPDEIELKKVLGETYSLWVDIKNYVFGIYPAGIEEWNFPGIKYGWSFRIKDKKRAIIYFLPREKYFKVGFVFGARATEEVLNSNISESIKSELKAATVYAEGRGIRIDIKDASIIPDIKTLIEIKLKY